MASEKMKEKRKVIGIRMFAKSKLDCSCAAVGAE